MRKLNILKMMSGIDDKFIKLADEDFDSQNAQHGMYIAVEGERFPWRAALISAACTAAVCCAAFLLVWKNGIIEIPAAANISDNSETSSTINDIGIEFNVENNNQIDLRLDDMSEIHVDSVFAFDDSGIIIRYNVGDKIGEYDIIEANSVFAGDNQSFHLIRQEFTLEAVENISDFFYSENENDLSIVFHNNVGEHLGLPRFSKGIQLDDSDSFRCLTGEILAHDYSMINAYNFKVTVDYMVGRITYSADEIMGTR